MNLRCAIEVVPFGDYANPRNVVRLAQAAEAAGWDGLFVWDHLAFVWGAPSGDSWVILTAVAQATERLRIGTDVTPLPRHRPYMLANTLATIDLLSGGRVILGAGSGGVAGEFAAFGEDDDAKVRAAKLDESLKVINLLWSGEKVNHQGTYYTVKDVTLAPLPVQRPRIPIWIGGESRPALRRAAQWDGWVIGSADEHGNMTKTPDDMRRPIESIMQQRASDTPFDIAFDGYSEPGKTSHVKEFADVGVTWWLEAIHGFRGNQEEMLARVKAGPPV